jgi:modification methylase
MLTKKQKKVLDYIQEYSQKKEFSPSHDEIRKHFKLSSVSTVNHYIKILQKKGYIKREKNLARSVEVKNKENLINVPFKGYIAAGQPIEAVEEFETTAVPSHLVSVGEHFTLGVRGNSMIDEGIFDGDIVVVKKQNSVENGETAVALINGNEVTLKKIYKEKNRIRLQPANPNLRPLFVKNVVIQGKVISAFRNFEEKEEFKFNQFLCGDVLDMMRKIPDSSIHFAITSPPYNVGKDYDNHDDTMNHQDYLDWLYKVWQETKRVLVSGGKFAINIAPTGIRDFVPIHHDYIEQMKKVGMKFRTEILWYKQTMLKRTAWGSFKSPANPHIVPSWEYVLIFSKDQDRLDGDQRMADITKEEFMKFSDGFWKIQPETKRKGHPAPFPEELIYRLQKFYSYKGNNILDMFGGTGTVATIAARTGRNFVHIDISPQYCKVARERVEKEKNQSKLIN